MAPDTPKLSGTSYVVLGLLEQLGPSSPYDLKRFIETSVENFWPVPHTTFYAEPARLARAGLLSEEQEASGRRRKLYRLTDRGRDALHEWVDNGEAAPPQLRDELMLKIFMGAEPGPLVAERMTWHREKGAELQGYLELVRAEGGYEGMERSLIAGITYNRVLLEMLERLQPDR